MRRVNVAAVQMDANPAPTAERLARAGRLVAAAAAEGAQLVVLPELFNVGYGYSADNHRRAEPLDGPTVVWMREMAAAAKTHLAGSLMLLDRDEVYNALLLYAPDGRVWRYDKHHPWAWERGYFCGAAPAEVTVAETALGNLGLLICWDVSHRDLWRQYAGRVDMMVISSCPPDAGNPTFLFPDGDRVTFDDMGLLGARLKGSAESAFGEGLSRQVAWLGVPAVHAVGCGHITTEIPAARFALLGYAIAAPWLAKYLPQAGQMRMSCDMVEGCKVLDAGGRLLTGLSAADGEAFARAEVQLADTRPSARGRQPASPLPWAAYVVSDTLLPTLTIPVYRKGLRRVWGPHMAPISPSTRRRVILLGLAAACGVLLGALLWRKRRGRA